MEEEEEEEEEAELDGLAAGAWQQLLQGPRNSHQRRRCQS
jgi:hypothetical protein